MEKMKQGQVDKECWVEGVTSRDSSGRQLREDHAGADTCMK